MTKVTKTIWFNGLVFYLKKGTDELHRTDGPAVIWPNGGKRWYQNNHLHRLDGPAVIWPHGYKEYWINGKWFTEQEFKDRTKK